MLIEYSIENFRSIREKKIFSMIPAKGNSKSYNLVSIEGNKNYKKLLKSSVIVGPNASGKTNVILALRTIKHLILGSKHMNKGDTFNDYEPFELDIEYSQKPTLFEISFIKDNIQYKYSFSYNREKIVTEELSYFVGKTEHFIFKRKDGNIEPFIDHKDLLKLFQYTGENVLFLSKANNEYKKFGPVFEWFNKNLLTITSISQIPSKFSVDYFNESDENKAKLIALMKSADFDIDGISGEITVLDDPELKTFIKKIIKKDKKGIGVLDNDDKIELINENIKTIRKRLDGSEIVKDFSKFESAGTQTFFTILGVWLEALEKSDKLLIIDEFDIRLHPDLQYFLLKIFHDKEYNKKNSQLIFTTHNTRILATDFFRREQIWLTEKNRDTKATELFSIYDYEKRDDRSIEKAYFTGRYGGLPDIVYKRL